MGRVRGARGNQIKVRVRRKTSATHEFLLLSPSSLKKASCPKGWMSPEGYRRYLKVTLQKMRIRQAQRSGARGLQKKRRKKLS